ncbi:hypothetical protein CVT24_007813 [Panaeolus cyanescens]|uniref:Protein-S-isoprenylcysteine O-methyltransferase n=1 Tax=Panaeolus cyanescens TaxID=181874 RepID=A0A409WL83_9AGAR|nr:hypothetical protein CVT24_007813 [Panaeolus cyanescens]
MSTLSLLSHVVCLVLSTIGFSVCALPPEEVDARQLSQTNRIRHRLMVFPIIQIFLYTAEISLILSSIFTPPSFTSTVSQIINSAFVYENGDPAHLHYPPSRITGSALIFIGTFICLQSVNVLGKFVTPQSEMALQKDHKLITSFPYSIVRHPGYLSVLLIHIGCVLVDFTRGSWVRECGVLLMRTGVGARLVWAYGMAVSLLPLMVLLKTREEDEMMKRRFGKEWEEWADKVKYWVIPGVF